MDCTGRTEPGLGDHIEQLVTNHVRTYCHEDLHTMGVEVLEGIVGAEVGRFEFRGVRAEVSDHSPADAPEHVEAHGCVAATSEENHVRVGHVSSATCR